MRSIFSASAVMNSEVELLVLSARMSRDEEDATKTAMLLQSSIDWRNLLREASAHGLIPLLYQRLSTACPEAVPSEMLNRLRDEALDNTKWNLALTQELFKVLDLFEANGIRSIPFKGPLLAATAYGDIALRQFVDLDILVRKANVVKAGELLISSGYKPEFYLTDEREAVLDKSRCEYAFYRDEVCGVDLHWAIVPRTFSFSPDPEAYWQRPHAVSLAGREVPTLSPEDLLLSLCIHGAKHFWRQLNWICDVAELIRAREDIDWQRLIAQAETAGNDRMLLLGLFLASELLGASLPLAVMQRIGADSVVEALAARVLKRLFREPEERAMSFEVDLFFARTMKSLKDKMRLLLGHTKDHFRPTRLEMELVALPRSLFFLYYLLRPLRLAGKYVRRWAGRNPSGGGVKQDL